MLESRHAGIPNCDIRSARVVDSGVSRQFDAAGSIFPRLAGNSAFPKSSAHVIILTLEKLGYVQKKNDSLNYSLGLQAYGLGLSMMKNLSVSEVALPHMRVLVDQLHLPAHLAVPDGEQGVYIQKVDAPGLIKIDTYVGRRMDLHCTGVGKIILAFGPAELRAITSCQSRPTSGIRATRSLRRGCCSESRQSS